MNDNLVLNRENDRVEELGKGILFWYTDTNIDIVNKMLDPRAEVYKDPYLTYPKLGELDMPQQSQMINHINRVPGIVTKILDKKIEKKKQILPNERIVRPSQLEKTLEEVNDLDKVLAWKGDFDPQDLKNREIYSILKNYDSSRIRHEEKYNFYNKFKDIRTQSK